MNSEGNKAGPDAIEALELSKKFDGFTAVDELTITVDRGELLALLGPNGAGKTTTVRMLSAILQPTLGTARINGHDVVQEADQVRRLIGMLTERRGCRYNGSSFWRSRRHCASADCCDKD